jgi:hypothetical protein
MLKVQVPPCFINERLYVLDYVINDVLGINYEVVIDEQIDKYIFSYNDDLFLVIEDHFFGKFSLEKPYHSIDNLPNPLHYMNVEFSESDSFVSLYHPEGCTKIFEPISTYYLCKSDIIASIFFMLTRWEDHINPNRDIHGRVSALNCVAYKFNFLHRPIVNEYIEFLWNIIDSKNFNIKRKSFLFSFVPTHDVDYVAQYYFLKFNSLIYQLIGDLIKRKSLLLFFDRVKSFVFSKFWGIKRDPFFTFEHIIKLSNKYGVKSYFNFFGGISNVKYDCNYSLNNSHIKNLLKMISDKGHFIGLHPSYESIKDKDIIKSEKDNLFMVCKELNINQFFWGGRQHYLKWDISETSRIWDNIGMNFDSSLGYFDGPGFRCGICYSFPIFDFEKKRKLKLVEWPLIIMECSYFDYLNLSLYEAKKRSIELLNKTKKYNGSFVLLWHNDRFVDQNSDAYKLYLFLISNI